MNKKILIVILAIILIIILAVFTGVKLGKKDLKDTNSNAINENITTPLYTNTPEIENSTPEPTIAPEPTPTPTARPTLNKDITQMSSKQKEEYAKEIAKKTWEELGAITQVSYKYEFIDDGKYIVSVRDSGTYALIWYKIDINTGTCEEY